MPYFFNSRQLAKAHDELVVSEIRAFKGQAIATGEAGTFYATAIHSCGYLFFKIVVLGTFRANAWEQTLKVKFSGYFAEEVVESDHALVETSYSQTLKLGITKFDILVEEPLKKFIHDEHLIKITILKEFSTGLFTKGTRQIPFVFFIQDLDSLKKLVVTGE